MLLYRNGSTSSLTKSRPLHERLTIQFPQLLLESTAVDIFNAIKATDRLARARGLERPIPAGKGGQTYLDFQAIAQSDYRDIVFGAQIHVPENKDTWVVDGDQVVKSTIPADYFVDVRLKDGWKYIWMRFADIYKMYAIDVAETSGDLEMLITPPAEWVQEVYEVLKKYRAKGATGNSGWVQNNFYRAFEQAFRACEIFMNCTCTFFDQKLRKSGLDWTRPVSGSHVRRVHQSSLDTIQGLKKSLHPGSELARRIENGETIYRTEADRLRKTNRATKLGAPGDKPLGAIETDDGELVVNSGWPVDKDGNVLAYPNGDPLDQEVSVDWGPDSAFFYDPEAKMIDPCTHIMRVLVSMLQAKSSKYELGKMLAQGIASTLWVNGKAPADTGMERAWRQWATGMGSSYVDKISREMYPIWQRLYDMA